MTKVSNANWDIKVDEGSHGRRIPHSKGHRAIEMLPTTDSE